MATRYDAEAFCRWLTDKERAAGRLLPGQVYRLPTDREWSAAMGVLNEPGDFPEERQFPKDVFTWEKDTQPARNAENLNWKNDAFANTAPVGSGQPNRFGLYDLLGNVKEFCADPWTFNSAISAVRGPSYCELQNLQRESIQDLFGYGDRARMDCGFRCVLDLETEEQRQMRIALEVALEKLRAYLVAAKMLGRPEISTLINDEMVLLNMSRSNLTDTIPLYEKDRTLFRAAFSLKA